ncbi:[Fe-Fe] hydrogenase large subunit C-terminal domain-containing protein [Abyssisolibacter fermentans]|uniref:[Fe-Fe] hydrogenase large subunit C-terminal domain-containing protein n=1 Tax=Abyssisolibacter fermentans TaxID=1766203 RepID=UPI0009E8F09D|nr:[Fe-Fe] hydrogenase large subunit C-terminal domain-containing protein [Abyssisolibacter fermentans]
MNKYFHSVILDSEKCTGCTNCMQKCPTEALRVKDKKAIILNERCIDCGNCIIACPYHAQKAVAENLDALKNYKYKIAIPATTLYGQFMSEVNVDTILQSVKDLGFDYVYDEVIGSDLARILIKNYIKIHGNNTKPLISSHCPSITRLIQSKFPTLMNNIVKIESPMEIAARLVKLKIKEKYGYELSEIGVFYITPCPAKITSIKNPIGIKKSYVDGAISINEIYGDIYKNIKKNRGKETENFMSGSTQGIEWALAGGQSKSLNLTNYIVVDGVENACKIFEKIELGKLNHIDYVEALACTGGCVGGALNVENPFVAENNFRNLLKENKDGITINEKYAIDLCKAGFVCWTEELIPKEIDELSSDIRIAFKKMEKINKLVKELPGLDCGSCGSPTCQAFAEDVVNGLSSIEFCVFSKNNDTQGYDNK